MKNTEKLKVVFDFIADYLSEDEITNELELTEEKLTEEEDTTVEELAVTEEDAKFKRAYSIMKKMDEMDKENAFYNQGVKETIAPIKEALNRVRVNYEVDKSVRDLSEAFEEKTGITLDANGKIAEVKVGPLKEYTSIKDILGTPNTIGEATNVTEDNMPPKVETNK
jgi:arginyl-tRNA synthetase